MECEAGEGFEPCKHSYPKETELILLAEPEFGSRFVKWSGACLGAGEFEECEITLSGAKTVTATFDLVEYPLTVSKDGTGTGTVKCNVGAGPEACKAKYPEGTELTLLAKANAGSEFVEWSGDCFGEEEECALTVEEAYSVTATFDLQPALTIDKTGTGTVTCELSGSGTAGPCASAYPSGTELVLHATPGGGYVFVGWTDAQCSFFEAEPCELLIEEAVTVVAEFGPIPKYALAVETKGAGAGTVTCEVLGSGTAGPCAPAYPSGTELNLYAVAGPGSEFVEWSGACLNKSCQLTVEEEALAVSATFELRPQVPFTVIESGTGASPTPEPQPEGMARAAGSALVSGRHAALKLICSGGPCRGALKLTTKVRQGRKVKALAIGTASFSLPAGSSETLTVKLSAAAKNELDRSGVLKATLSGTGIAGSTVKLKPGRR